MWEPDTNTDHYAILGRQGRERRTLSLVAEGGANKVIPEEMAFELFPRINETFLCKSIVEGKGSMNCRSNMQSHGKDDDTSFGRAEQRVGQKPAQNRANTNT